MRLPTQEIKPNEERKRRRRTALFVNGNFPCGNVGNEEMDDVMSMRQNKVENFSHHKRVADYLLGRSVGEGSFAKVRLGLHVQTAEEVAIKIVSKARARADAYVHKNLRREGKILQMTRHANIVQVYDVLETDNNYYLVTEFCKGGELIDIVSEKGCLPENDVRRYMVQLVSAVAHLHDLGIVHRDLKVENLLLGDRGELKIIDFGLSNTISGTHTDPTRALATQCGSPAYAAPELLAKNKYGSKVDVWSIGIITYALLVGKLPFTVEPFRIPKLCRKMLLGDMNPIPSHLSANCRHFIRRLLVADPDMRPNITQASKMAWIGFAGKNSKIGSFGKPREEFYSTTDIDTEVVREMTSKLEFEFSNVLHCVRKNRPGEALTTYYLLLKQKTRFRDSSRLGLRRHGDVIGSDGNLDRENKSDKSGEEDGSNATDDAGDDVIGNGICKEDSYKALPETPGDVVEKKETEAHHFNRTFVDEILEKHLKAHVPHDPEESLKHHDNNSPKSPAFLSKTDTGAEDTDASSSVSKSIDQKLNAGFDGTLKPPKNARQRVEERRASTAEDLERPNERKSKEADSAATFPDSGSSSKLPELKYGSGARGAAKPERKSRGPASMRELMKTMSRAKEALQRRSIFGQSKANRGEAKRNSTDVPELNMFRRLISRNGNTTERACDEKDGVLLYTNETFQSEERLWKKFVPNGSHPVRVKLPEATPPATPSTVDGRSSNAYANHKAPRATVLHQERVSLPQRNSVLNGETGSDCHPTPDYPDRRLPRILREKNREIMRSPLHCDNLPPRHSLPHTPRVSISSETATPDAETNGVKRIVDKFHALMNNSDQLTCANSRQQAHRTSPSLRDSSGVSRLKAHRKRREDAAHEIGASFTKTTAAKDAQAVNATSNGIYSVLRQKMIVRNERVTMRKSNLNFTPRFADKEDFPTYEAGGAPSNVPIYRGASRGIWYKSAV